MMDRRRLDLIELAATLGVSPLEVVSWIAEGFRCYTADGVELDLLTPAQERANRGLGARIRAARTEADFAALCLEVEAAVEAGDLPRPRAQALIDHFAFFISAARHGLDASRRLGGRRRFAARRGDVTRKLTMEELAGLLRVSPRRLRAWLRRGCPCERDAEGAVLLEAPAVARWNVERELAALSHVAAVRPPFPALAEGIRRADSFRRVAELAREVAAEVCRFTLSLAQAAALEALLREAHIRVLRDHDGDPEREAS